MEGGERKGEGRKREEKGRGRGKGKGEMVPHFLVQSDASVRHKRSNRPSDT